MIKAVFFDFYNTLVDYDPPREETQSRLLGELGIKISPQELLRPIMVADDFLSKEHSRQSLAKRSKEETMALYGQYQGIILREAGLEASAELIGNILKKWMSADLKMVLYDDVAPALDKLKEQGLTLGLISNVDRDISSVYEELGLGNWLGVTITSQAVGFNKPHPEILRMAVLLTTSLLTVNGGTTVTLKSISAPSCLKASVSPSRFLPKAKSGPTTSPFILKCFFSRLKNSLGLNLASSVVKERGMTASTPSFLNSSILRSMSVRKGRLVRGASTSRGWRLKVITPLEKPDFRASSPNRAIR